MRNIVGGLILIVGICFILYPYAVREVNKIDAIKISKEYLAYQEKDNVPSDAEQQMDSIKKCNESITKQNKYLEDPFESRALNFVEESCEKNIFGDEVIGILSIPKLELVEPIYFGTSEAQLGIGVGMLEGSSIPVGEKGNHTVLAGHRGMATKEMFQHFDKLEVGDVFLITTFSGELHYQIYDMKVNEPNNTASLKIQPGKDLVTLFTCTPYLIGTERLMVYGERVEKNVADEEGNINVVHTTQTIEKIEKKFNFKVIIVGILLLISCVCLLQYKSVD
ncbi:class C sortase [Kurthia massiliensis]|uniref:class C sortase n=1 Tax=Kurthia massiliensis TaxID=1033739 RepID=UPI0002887934|nr:class C sortase [Kurthia massiliensis]